MSSSTRHAILQMHNKPLPGTLNLVSTSLKFHCPFTLAECENLLRQAETKRDELDQQYAGLVDGVTWHGNKHELQPKRPFVSVGSYLLALKKVQVDVQVLEGKIDEAIRSADTIKSQEMWELAERMGLSYPQVESEYD